MPLTLVATWKCESCGATEAAQVAVRPDGRLAVERPKGWMLLAVPDVDDSREARLAAYCSGPLCADNARTRLANGGCEQRW